ncbi:MAG TPA: outer membrane protein assembly factor BamD [Saprospiraceae bacterium]|nr:outer membrane protein assembly factor BamD [Saprospiraceae bacterium]
MKIRSFWGVMPVLLILGCITGGCRSEFEKVRLSNEPERILNAAHKYYEDGEYLRAQTLYELVLSQYRGRPEAENLYFRYAYSHYYLRQYTLAAHYFNNFSTTFAYSELREEVDYMAAYSNFQLSPGYRLEQSQTIQAIQGFQDFVNRYPTSPRVAECNRLIDEMRAKLEEKAYASAALYYDIGEYEAAIQSFENMLRDFPDTERLELVRYQVLRAAYLFAEKSIYEKRRERYELAIEKYMDFKRKFPKSNYKAEVETIYNDCQEQIKNLNQ